MATFIPTKLSELAGRASSNSGEMSVTIAANGQIRFSQGLVSKLPKGTTHVAAAWLDPKNRVYAFQPVNDVESYLTLMNENVADDYTEDDLIALNTSAVEGCKTGCRCFGATKLLNNDLVSYKYKDSGTQMFPAKYDESENLISFTVPEGVIPKRNAGRGRPKSRTVGV